MKTEVYIEITNKERNQLIKSQQGELDGVMVYRKLASITKETNKKEIFLKIAADEGKHAGILKGYTSENLKPKNLKAHIVAIINKVFGMKLVLKVIEKGEFKAARQYSPLVKKFPNIKEIIKDEEIHGNVMKNMY